ncbi:beta-ketoacyl-[acyl-carrier-protein] synthase family protein [Teredinibacter waterburyi]|uniref:beta-ketoacyl-[acyl-carrier-protein] synthase family protein n=1 Tax=Teredinibacter waterburyi TaxID=1500538 RepID=UPI00165F58ED|nr:beta-ketoacyl-[acyl-carrier-protein] synthase family protein [Teredinibacter waterburyi]
MSNRVVVTGIGLVSPIGHDLSTFWSNCLRGESAAAPIPEFWQNFYDYKSIFWSELILPDYKALGYSAFMRSKTDPAALNSIIAAKSALNDAGLSLESTGKHQSRLCDYDAGDVGVYVGTGIGGIASFIDSYNHQSNSVIHKSIKEFKSNFLAEPKSGSAPSEPENNPLSHTESLLHYDKKFNPFVVSMHMPNASAANIGISLGVTGECNTYSYACASSTISIGEAFRSVASGTVKCAIAGGTEYMHDPYGAIFRAFDQGGTLTRHTDSPRTCNMPFDKGRSGFMFSEGGACYLVLEDYDSALARGANIYGEISGYSRNFEGYSTMIIEPSGRNIKSLLGKLLAQAGIEGTDIQYVNSHGTGTVPNDDVESEAIEHIVGKKAFVNSTKSILGHSLGASGAFEAAVTFLSIKNQQLHPSANISDPVRDLNFVTKPTEATITRAITQSFAFGGHNAALLCSSIINE